MKKFYSTLILIVAIVLVGISATANASNAPKKVYGPEEYHGQKIEIYKLNPQEYHGQKLYNFNLNK